jgi:hypothetical protein
MTAAMFRCGPNQNRITIDLLGQSIVIQYAASKANLPERICVVYGNPFKQRKGMGKGLERSEVLQRKLQVLR